VAVVYIYDESRSGSVASRDLYAIEKKARDMGLPPEMVYEERQQKSKPIVDKFKLWLEELAPTVPPKSLLGKAVNYTLGQWPRLIKYLDNGILRMDKHYASHCTS
jgi:transposase